MRIAFKGPPGSVHAVKIALRGPPAPVVKIAFIGPPGSVHAMKIAVIGSVYIVSECPSGIVTCDTWHKPISKTCTDSGGPLASYTDYRY